MPSASLARPSDPTCITVPSTVWPTTSLASSADGLLIVIVAGKPLFPPVPEPVPAEAEVGIVPAVGAGLDGRTDSVMAARTNFGLEAP